MSILGSVFRGSILTSILLKYSCLSPDQFSFSFSDSQSLDDKIASSVSVRGPCQVKCCFSLVWIGYLYRDGSARGVRKMLSIWSKIVPRIVVPLFIHQNDFDIS